MLPPKKASSLSCQEWQRVTLIGKQMSGAFGIDVDSIRPDSFLKERDISLSGMDLNIIHTPGHSPGSAKLYWPLQQAPFTGVLVFREGVGRTDLLGGDGSKLKNSIKRLVELEVDWLLPGYGQLISGAKQVRRHFEDIERFYCAYV